MTRVLMVSSLWPPAALGGAEIYAERLTRELCRRGHEVGVVTMGVDGADVLQSVPPWPYRLDSWARQPRWKRSLFHAADVHRPDTARAIAAAIARFAPDVVHTHAVQGLSTTALTSPTRCGQAHVHTLHDYWLLCQRTTLRRRSGERCRRCSACGAIRAVRRLALRRNGPDLFVAPSEAVARHHDAIANRTGAMRIIRHPVDPPDWPRRRTRPMPGRAEPPTFGYLGQLTPVKGVQTLVRAFEEVAAQVPGACLVVAGSGPLADLVGVDRDPAIRALGWVGSHDKERFFATIDCLVVPSEWDEPAGLVVGEAAARGVPVIAADIGGIPEYVAPSDRSRLFRSGDTDALVRAMLTVASEVPTAEPTVEHLSTWPAHVDEVLGAYADAGVAARRRRERP